jgi:hypothetical protein
MARASHFFDIESPEQFYSLLKATAQEFSSRRGKSIKVLLLLVFGLTHLREWIAPDYDSRVKPIQPEEKFYQAIFGLPEFNILRNLCNRSKHMDTRVQAMGPLYGGTLDDAPDFDAIMDFDRGPPTAYFVDGRDVEEVISIVIAFYENNWFKK